MSESAALDPEKKAGTDINELIAQAHAAVKEKLSSLKLGKSGNNTSSALGTLLNIEKGMEEEN